MYTRSYQDEPEALAIPEGYSGTSITGRLHNTPTEPPEPCEPKERGDEALAESAGLFSGLTSKLGLGNLFGGIFGDGKFGLSKIGTEELLIIAAAAFLFFSRDGDKECAILLLLLLFIN